MVSVLLAVFAASALADNEGVRDYKNAVSRGAALFQAGDYASARSEFARAYEIHPNRVLIFNIASTYRREGDVQGALTNYRRFLELARTTSSHRVRLARRTVRSLEQALARGKKARQLKRFEAESRRRAEARLRTRERAERLAREEADARTRAKAKRRRAIKVDLLEQATARGASSRGGGLRIGGLTLTLAGGAAMAWALHEANTAFNAGRELELASEWNNEQADLHARGQDAQRRAQIFGAAGLTLAVTGVVIYVLGRRSSETPRTTITPVVTPGGGGAMLQSSF